MNIIAIIGAVLISGGLIVMFAGQFYLVAKIGQNNSLKAYLCFIPPILFLNLIWNDEVKKICEDYPRAKKIFYSGLIMMAIGFLLAMVINET